MRLLFFKVLHKIINRKTGYLIGLLIGLYTIPSTLLLGASIVQFYEPAVNHSLHTANNQRQQLNPGETIRRQLLSVSPHTYQIVLSAAQYLHLNLKTEDGEIIITLFDLNFRKIVERTSFQTETIPLSFIAQSSGIYMIKVELTNVSSTIPRYYELQSENLRTATARDHQFVLAENFIAEAQSLLSVWKSASLLEAIKKYEQAGRCLRAIEERLAEACTLQAIGDTYAILSHNHKAIYYYNQALRLSQELKSAQIESEIFNSLGSVYIDLSDTTTALNYCNKALTISRNVGHIRGEAQALNNIALCYYNRSDLDKAADLFHQALTLWKQLNDTRGQAETLTNIGYTYSDLGDIGNALKSFNQGLALWQRAGNKRGQALVLNALGLEYSWLGEPQKALDAHKEAYQTLHNIGNIMGEAIALTSIGHAYDILGEKDKALIFFQQALQQQRASGNRYGEAITLGHIGRVYYALNNNSKALLHYRQKLSLVKLLRDPRAEAYTLKDIGAVFDSLRQSDAAATYYNRALQLASIAKDPRGQAYALNAIGYIHDRRGDKQKAFKLYIQALGLLDDAEDRAGKVLTQYHIARVKRDMGNLAGALEDIQTILNLVESLRIKVDSQDLRSSYFASVQQYYKLGVEVLMLMHQHNPLAGFDVAAYEMNERSRARSLLEVLAETHINFHEGADTALLQRESELQQSLQMATQRQIVSGSKDGYPAKLKAEIAKLTSEYEEVRMRIRATNSRYAALTQPQTLTLSEVQQQILDNDTVLLEYSLGEEKSYLWAITSSSIQSYVLPKGAEIETMSRRVFDILLSYQNGENGRFNQTGLREEYIDQKYWQAASLLSQTILKPAATLLQNKRILVVTEGALQYTPFSGLPRPVTSPTGIDPSTASSPKLEPLFIRHEIIHLPSASTLAILRKQTPQITAPAKALAVFADPVFESDDSRLKSITKGKVRSSESKPAANLVTKHQQTPQQLAISRGKEGFPRLLASRREAEAIMAFAVKENSLLATDFQASLTTLMNTEMSRYRVVHFATHGLYETEHPELSAIVLSLVDKNGKLQNGFLRMHEIYNLNLPVDMVVLSACQTALGKDIKGEGLVGITRGFMYAGAVRVVSSLWKVDDDATAEFMKNFYRNLLQEGKPAAAALRSAQIDLWNEGRWKSPCYWAAFVFQGEWK
jgi:CHAT domain-containing protein/tetratricopeptide (TPR) repeat protein